MGVPFIHKRVLKLKLKRKTFILNSLVLTFDDGPGSRLTPAVLGILAENNVRATFFLMGRNISGREHIVKEMAKQGHEICSHGYEHLHHWRISPIRAIRDIKRGWQAINTALGVNKRSYPFRPPYGQLNIFSLLYLWIYRVPVIYWSADLGDTWKTKFSSQVTIFVPEMMRGAVFLSVLFSGA